MLCKNSPCIFYLRACYAVSTGQTARVYVGVYSKNCTKHFNIVQHLINEIAFPKIIFLLSHIHFFLASITLFCNEFEMCIKTHNSESRGQEEAATTE